MNITNIVNNFMINFKIVYIFIKIENYIFKFKNSKILEN